MNPKQLALLEKLAALKARKSLGTLSAVRARRAAEQTAEAESRADAARVFETTPESGAELQFLHHLSAASLTRATAAKNRADALAPQEAAARDAAAREKGREIALGGMAEKARATQRKEAEKKAERAAESLSLLKRFR